MKKLMLVVAVAFAAMAGQAAYVDWQYSGSNAKYDESWGTTAGAESSSGLTAYLLTAAAYDGLGAKWDQAALAAAAADSSSLIVAKWSKSTGTYSTHGEGSTVAGARQVEAESGKYYVILAGASGYDIVAENVDVTAYGDVTQGGTGKTPGITLEGQDNTALSFTQYPGGGVPEPTSGLLLALGAAMLALRRKQK